MGIKWHLGMRKGAQSYTSSMHSLRIKCGHFEIVLFPFATISKSL